MNQGLVYRKFLLPIASDTIESFIRFLKAPCWEHRFADFAISSIELKKLNSFGAALFACDLRGARKEQYRQAVVLLVYFQMLMDLLDSISDSYYLRISPADLKKIHSPVRRIWTGKDYDFCLLTRHGIDARLISFMIETVRDNMLLLGKEQKQWRLYDVAYDDFIRSQEYTSYSINFLSGFESYYRRRNDAYLGLGRSWLERFVLANTTLWFHGSVIGVIGKKYRTVRSAWRARAPLFKVNIPLDSLQDIEEDRRKGRNNLVEMLGVKEVLKLIEMQRRVASKNREISDIMEIMIKHYSYNEVVRKIVKDYV